MKLTPALERKLRKLAPGSAKLPKKQRTKYGNRKCVVDGHKFDSEKEARRYLELKALEKAGVIKGLSLQYPIACVVNGQKVCTYIADSRYVEAGRWVVEDVKSEITRRNPVYRLKWKLVKACTGIEIQEV